MSIKMRYVVEYFIHTKMFSALSDMEPPPSYLKINKSIKVFKELFMQMVLQFGPQQPYNGGRRGLGVMSRPGNLALK
jgi:hypothetical protein